MRSLEEIAEAWLADRPLLYQRESLVAALREAADAARQEVIATANEAWPEDYGDEPANSASDLKCRIKNLLSEANTARDEPRKALTENG